MRLKIFPRKVLANRWRFCEIIRQDTQESRLSASSLTRRSFIASSPRAICCSRASKPCISLRIELVSYPTRRQFSPKELKGRLNAKFTLIPSKRVRKYPAHPALPAFRICVPRFCSPQTSRQLSSSIYHVMSNAVQGSLSIDQVFLRDHSPTQDDGQQFVEHLPGKSS